MTPLRLEGLDRTWHMSFMTGQDRTPKFAGRVLPDRTESGPIFLMIYGPLIRIIGTNLVLKVLNYDQSKNLKKIFEKNSESKVLEGKSPVSGQSGL